MEEKGVNTSNENMLDKATQFNGEINYLDATSSTTINIGNAIAETISFNIKESLVIAEAIIDSSLLPHLTELKTPPNKIETTSQSRAILNWYGGDALYAVENLWEQIQQKQGITATFAQKYGKAVSILRQSYSSLKVQRTLPNAVLPAKAHPLDSGFDVTIIRVVNPNFGPGVVLFGTGLKVRPPDGFYIDLVARSSTAKMGWALANSVGIIDAQYRGELCVPMFKISKEADEMQLPARVAQMIVRPLAVTDVEEVNEIGDTSRGINGFGSSGNLPLNLNPAKQNSFPIFVRTLNGKVIEFEVSSNETIQELKNKIQYKIGDHGPKKLVFNAKVLRDDQTIGECEIVSGSKIFMVLQLKNG
ncbi:dUTP pyrophosphatase [Histomonas meleagridis]|uniref:dUTP pyrophosphatase n=1 Tax=Histomonas meleagridis TaxID=135588 RepID=UPI003559D058|nr:dUTP pyrophosphatase [Histomonas meleagridis]KAH0799118.1 dUTP pyrophosphatase [Histomonas meleagridis]